MNKGHIRIHLFISELYTDYRKLAMWGTMAQSGAAKCQADEFPMGNLLEGQNLNYQVVRLVNGAANGRQGNDWQQWKEAYYYPCSVYRPSCGHTDALPVTWEFGTFGLGDPRAAAPSYGKHFIRKYGFDSQTPYSYCFPTCSMVSALPSLFTAVTTSSITLKTTASALYTMIQCSFPHITGQCIITKPHKL
ncbi:hypothetical protein P152DRAFT_514547 [Eremomyces bilateralis CBS 781.70]|uniref:Uncharacterized protein n=1 Tax=Eremomyces bilateralis CBS 781.70 TaxID=1392243 RepID=A0A6G1G3D5_9PEZI|nr:uncharacterized protein P152DRAFT_514547 [Eremomyces bilateralis CBS 781.70]KAF1812430.1 hypothetical protein P152DRAFT_514547 [Eremomyces bilateralis CBS 781.70]